ncbi:cytochrome c [Halomonas alkalicola]|uniref:cytochrome c n=1 Tax=Halomonas alkalicola TaxID=1930622 RepID=UPI00265E649E|nr:cytochrome c [Halomonas alkalicola]
MTPRNSRCARQPGRPRTPALGGLHRGLAAGDGHGIETRALAVIGDDWAGFEERQATFRREAATLAEMVEDEAEFSDLRRQMGAVVNSCRGCHDNYRAD